MTLRSSSPVCSRPASLLATAGPALAASGITPLSPKSGATVPAGKSPDLQDARQGRGPGLGPRLQVQEEEHRRRDLQRRVDRPGQEEGQHLHQYKPKFFNFPEFWLNSPGTYYWQAHRIQCEGNIKRLPPGGPDRQVQGRRRPRSNRHGRRRALHPREPAHLGGRRLLARRVPRLAPDRRAAAVARLPRDPGQPGGRRGPRRALLPGPAGRSGHRGRRSLPPLVGRLRRTSTRRSRSAPRPSGCSSA